MKAREVLEAADALSALKDAKALRATLKGGKHRLRLYALSDKETIEDEVEVDDDNLSEMIVSRVVTELTQRLKSLGVTDTNSVG